MNQGRKESLGEGQRTVVRHEGQKGMCVCVRAWEGVMAQAGNPSYSRGRDQESCSLSLA
jgi:hypothetical protein